MSASGKSKEEKYLYQRQNPNNTWSNISEQQHLDEKKSKVRKIHYTDVLKTLQELGFKSVHIYKKLVKVITVKKWLVIIMKKVEHDQTNDTLQGYLDNTKLQHKLRQYTQFINANPWILNSNNNNNNNNNQYSN